MGNLGWLRPLCCDGMTYKPCPLWFLVLVISTHRWLHKYLPWRQLLVLPITPVYSFPWYLERFYFIIPLLLEVIITVVYTNWLLCVRGHVELSLYNKILHKIQWMYKIEELGNLRERNLTWRVFRKKWSKSRERNWEYFSLRWKCNEIEVQRWRIIKLINEWMQDCM